VALPEYVTLTVSPAGTVVTVTGRAEPLYVWLSPPSVTVAVVGAETVQATLMLSRTPCALVTCTMNVSRPL